MKHFRHLTSCALAALGAFASTSLGRSAAPPGVAGIELSAPLRALHAMAIPDGFESDLWAAEPLVMDPVTMCIDEQGRIFVAESFRQELGIEDNRSQPYWLMDDLASQTVQDRLAMYTKWAFKRPDGMAYYTDQEDRVRVLADMTGDGHADVSFIFADGFNNPLDGTAAGLVARDGDVYLADIPNLWLLQDCDGDFKADFKVVLQTGFGVRVTLRGHDMHGLIWGPDGRLYWSIGDRGYHLTLPDGRVLHSPGSGAVFRCNPDGTDLQVVHHGLRNPQELAFDEYGNLFTGDNNSDAGDRARLVYIVEGGETGWDMSYQTLEGANLRGPWSQEGIWEMRHEGQPAWTLPPVAHIASGPSGLVCYPGTGLPDAYDGHFFLCDFRGGNDSSQILTFGIEPDGAGFKMVDEHPFVSHVLATDVDFGYDGKMYIADWGAGWTGNGEGRIYTVWNPQTKADPIVDEVQRIFQEGFKQRDDDELARFLGHPDMRVRLRAEFALAERGLGWAEMLSGIAHQSTNQRARLHAIWGLGIMARQCDLALADPNYPMARIADLLDDLDPEVRAQTARTMGDVKFVPAGEALQQALLDDSPRVKYFAAMALGHLQYREAIDDLITMIWTNDNKDLYIRHAGVMALYWMNDLDTVITYVADESPAVRLAALLVLRRAGDPRLADFLADKDERLVTEATRAINDLPIDEDTAALAALLNPASAEMLEVDENAPSPHRFTRSWYRNASRGALASASGASINDRLAQINFDRMKLDETDETSILEGKVNAGDDYLTRIVGTLVVPQTGDYRFQLCSDDDSILLLSADENPSHARRMAFVDGWVGAQQWDEQPSQTSNPIHLDAGQRCAIEVRHYENAGEDHLAVGWILPDGKIERPIGGGVQVQGNEPLLRRAINANLRLGQAHNAAVLADLAQNPQVPMSMRLEALSALADWVDPSPRDRVNGFFRPVDQSQRDPACITAVLERKLPGLIAHGAAPVASAGRTLAAQYHIQLDNRANLKAVLDTSLPDQDRAQALLQLSRDRDATFDTALATALSSDRPVLRALARDVIARIDPHRAMDEFIAALKGPTIVEQQAAIRGLAGMEAPEATSAIAGLAQRLQAGTLPRELYLETIEVVAASTSPRLKPYQISEHNLTPGVDFSSLAVQSLLIGGDAQAGRAVFTGSSAVSCMRCHAISGQGGEAGPDLAGVAGRLTREQMVQSLLDPNAVLAKGFDPPSAMIPVGTHLQRRQIRDLVEYLATLQQN